MAEDQTNPGTTVELPDPVSGVTIGVDSATGEVIARDLQFTPVMQMNAAPAEHTPTPEEAREMFAENPGLWAVLTTEGNKLRGEC